MQIRGKGPQRKTQTPAVAATDMVTAGTKLAQENDVVDRETHRNNQGVVIFNLKDT